jgi:hypothetical protein
VSIFFHLLITQQHHHNNNNNGSNKYQEQPNPIVSGEGTFTLLNNKL